MAPHAKLKASRSCPFGRPQLLSMAPLWQCYIAPCILALLVRASANALPS